MDKIEELWRAPEEIITAITNALSSLKWDGVRPADRDDIWQDVARVALEQHEIIRGALEPYLRRVGWNLIRRLRRGRMRDLDKGNRASKSGFFGVGDDTINRCRPPSIDQLPEHLGSRCDDAATQWINEWKHRLPRKRLRKRFGDVATYADRVTCMEMIGQALRDELRVLDLNTVDKDIYPM